MPTAKEVAMNLAKVQKRPVSEQLGEFKAKYNMKSKDSQAYRERAELQMKMNEQVIGYLRQQNKRRRTAIAQHENGDEHVIKSVFKDDRESRLSLQRCTADEAKSEMDQKVCEGAKLLNMLSYERQKLQKRLADLNEDHARMTMIEDDYSDRRNDKTATYLENALDKALIKFDTATAISRKYRQILDKLQEESLSMPFKLETMEQAVMQKRGELESVKELEESAQAARDSAKKELYTVEQTVYRKRRENDAELNAKRKEVDRRKTEFEKVEKKLQRNLLLTDQQDLKAAAEMQLKRDDQKKILDYCEAMDAIEMACHVTDIEDVLTRVETQQETHAQLINQAAELEKERTTLRTQVEKLQNQFHELKFGGEPRLSTYHKMLDEIDTRTCNKKIYCEKAYETLARNGGLLTGIKDGVKTLIEKLSDVKLKPPLHSFTKGDVLEQINLCHLKLEQLIKDINGKFPTKTLEEKLNDPDFQDYMESQIIPENVRVKLQVSKPKIEEFNFEGEEDVPVLGSSDIKKIGQKLIESKEKPKKKKSKKK